MDRPLSFSISGKTCQFTRDGVTNLLDMTPNALSIHLRVPASRINELVRERRAVTVDTALRLARYFNTTAQFWLNLQINYDLKVAERALGNKIQDEIQSLVA